MGLALYLAAESGAGSDGALVALIGGIFGVIGITISGGFAYLASRKTPVEPPPAREVDPMTTHELTRQMSELYQEAEERAARQSLRADMWEARALAGWKP